MNVFYHINNELSNNNLDKTKQLLDSIDINTLKNIKSYYSLLLKYFIKTKNMEMINKLVFNNILMKRDYLLFCKYSNNIEKNKIVVNIMLKKDEITTKDIDYIIEHCPYILHLFDGYYCQTKNKSNFNTYSILKQYNIDDIKEKIIDFYKTKISIIEINNCLSNHDIILDGGNIAFFNIKNNIPNYYNILKILKLVEDKNPLIIIHKKHMKVKNKAIDILKNKYIKNLFITPYQKYDDYYIIYSIIKKGIPVISNDKYRDHIYDMFKIFYKDDVYNFNKVSNFIKDNIITYSLNNIDYKSYHYNFSRCIQCIDNNIYVPTIDSFCKIE